MKTTKIREGRTEFIVPQATNKSVPTKKDPVFFNKYQEFNRDFSILIIRAFKKINNYPELIGAEPLAGMGVRSLRYLIEVPLTKIYLNDISATAVDMIGQNINSIGLDKMQVDVTNREATIFLSNLREKSLFPHIIDIDPFGTPIPFIQSAVRSLRNKGLLGCTATDLPVLTGIYRNKINYLYGVTSFDRRIHNYHELAIRVLLGGIIRQALVNEITIVPVVSFYFRHYIRVMMLKTRGVTKGIDSLGYIGICNDCKTRMSTNLNKKRLKCSFCGSQNFSLVGPLYISSLHNIDYLRIMQQDAYKEKMGSFKRINKYLTLMINETTINEPWSYDLPILAKSIKVTLPSVDTVCASIIENGYKCVRTHFSGQTIKTTASEPVLLEILQKL